MKSVKCLAAAVVAVAAFLAVVGGAFAGRVPMPGSDVKLVAGKTRVSYKDTFRGGERATVVVRGDGSTDLDLFVYDEFGNLVASDTDSTDYCVATFTPRWTGKFTIKVVNHGRGSNLYRLTTN